MTIPLDNLYDYIFDLTEHTNKNLIMYRFHPHGSKNIKDLTVHNNVENVFYTLKSIGSTKTSFHYKLLFCYDQEPLNFDLYAGDYFDEEREKIFKLFEGDINQFNNPIGKQLVKKKNIAGHPQVTPSIYDKKLLLHSEKNSKDLKKYEKNGFMGVYYWSHAFLALDWYRFAKHDKSLEFTKKLDFKKDFNVYARAYTGSREYRLKFLETLSKKSIDKKSNIFFNYDNSDYPKYKFENSQWQVDTKNIDNLICHNNENISSSASATYNTQDYKNSAIDVVLETVFDRNKIQLTEKILRPIACGKPFILVSGKESLEYLKSYGFKTFDSLIDEQYDKISCPKKRLDSIINTMKSITDLSKKRKNKLFLEMHEIANYNKNWFFSEEFFNIINAELKNNLRISLDILDQPENQTGKVPMLEYRAYRRFRQYFNGDAKNLADRCVREYPERIELSKKYRKVLILS